MRVRLYHERMQPRSECLPDSAEENGNDAQRAGLEFKVLGFPNPVLNEVLEKTSSKIKLHLKDTSMVWVQGFGKRWETSLQWAVLSHTVFPFVWGWLGVGGQIFLPAFSFRSTTVSSVIWPRVRLYPLRNAFTNILRAGATGIKHRQSPGCPASPPFTLQRFRGLPEELPERVGNSWHWKFPWSQPACRKGCLFFSPENNVLPRHCPNGLTETHERFVLTNLWKAFPRLS